MAELGLFICKFIKSLFTIFWSIKAGFKYLVMCSPAVVGVAAREFYAVFYSSKVLTSKKLSFRGSGLVMIDFDIPFIKLLLKG